MMIGNWLINSITTKELDRLEKYHHQYAYYRPALKIYVHDGPTLMKIILEITNPDTRVSTRDMKDKLCTVDISQFDGDVKEMLNYMEDLYTVIIAEGEDHPDFDIDLLNALRTVQDKSFLHILEEIQDLYKSGEKLTTEKIILQATRKYHNLIQRNTYQYKGSRKYLNFATGSNNNVNPKDAIAEWRKIEIPG